MAERPVTLLAMRPDLPSELFDDEARALLDTVAAADLDRVVDDFSAPGTSELLADADILLTSWGSPRIDGSVLDRAPRLRAIVHAAGSVKHHVEPVCWERGLLVTSAAAANARPVAEFALAAILMAGKDAFAIAARFGEGRSSFDPVADFREVGNYRRTVGVIGASRTGRILLELLRPFDLRVLLTDPFTNSTAAAALGAELVETDEIFARSDVVTVHAPELPSTRHLVDARRLALMKDGATLVNTARGSLVDTGALTAEVTRGRLRAVLDVTDPEPLPSGSPLWDCSGAFLTPHLSGSAGSELARVGRQAVDEVVAIARGQAPHWPVSLADLTTVA